MWKQIVICLLLPLTGYPFLSFADKNPIKNCFVHNGVHVLSVPTPIKKCFMNEGLNKKTKIEMTLDEQSGHGTLTREEDPPSASLSEPVTFSAQIQTKGASTQLYITFPTLLPYSIPIVWTLKKIRGNEVLIIPTYGKNHVTEKYQIFETQYVPCQ